MTKLITLIDFIAHSFKIKFWEVFSSIAIVVLFGILYEMYILKNSIYAEHANNKASTQNSVKPLDKGRITDYQALLDWFITSDNNIPIGAASFITDIEHEAASIVKVLNDEMERINDIQRKAIERALNGRTHLDSDDKAISVLTNAYKDQAPDVAVACSDIFKDGSPVRPQGLTSDAKTMLNRSHDPKSKRGSLEFAIISNHEIPLEETTDKQALEAKWWKFSPVCHLFNTFSEEVRKKLDSNKNVKTVNDALTTAFAPSKFTLADNGELTPLEGEDPNLRVRAIYLGLDAGPRISFPGTKYSSAEQILYAPRDRPWYRLIHEPPTAYKVGECTLTSPYADVGSQLLVVRTIVCKGERISIGRSPKNFALGIDVVINKSNQVINDKLKAISARIEKTATPFASLQFTKIDSEPNNLSDDSGKAESTPESVKAEGKSSDSQKPKTAIELISTYFDENTLENLNNDGSKSAILIILAINIFRLKYSRYVYALLLSTTLFGAKENQSSEISQRLTLGFNHIASLLMALKRTFTTVDETTVQRSVRAKQDVNIVFGKSFKYSLLGLEVRIPIKFRFCEVELSQNRADPISILKVHNFWGKELQQKYIESVPELLSAVTIAANDTKSKAASIDDTKKRYMSATQIIPSPICDYSSIKKMNDRVLLLERKRVRLNVCYEELGELYEKNSIKVVNRLSDVASAMNHQYKQYIELLERSSENVVRYILCTENELDEFKQIHTKYFDELNDLHKTTNSEIHFVPVQETLGANLFNTKREQFILLENFVLVIEGLQNITIRGTQASEETLLTGYVSWNIPDLNYYKLFTQEIEKKINDRNNENSAGD